MSNLVRYHSTTNRGPSVNIWGDLSHWQNMASMGEALLVWDDFIFWNTAGGSAATSYHGNGWTLVVGANHVLLTQVAAPAIMDGEIGALYWSQLDADRDDGYLTTSVSGTQFLLDTNCKKVCFEVKLKSSGVADSTASFFAGLASVGAAVNGTLTDDTGALISSKSFLGFNRLDADGNAINSVVQHHAVTQLNPMTTAAVQVADTYIKLGFVFDPHDASNKLRWYVDGVEQASSAFLSGTSTTAPYGIDAANFPHDMTLAPLVAFMDEGGSNIKHTVDWVCCGQMI